MAPKVIILLMLCVAYFGSLTNAVEKIRLKLSVEECYDMVRLATAGDRLDMVRLLVGQGCGVNRPTGSKSKAPTPLHIAVVNDNFQMVKDLVAYGAEINAKATVAAEVNKDKRGSMCKYLLIDGSINNIFDFLETHKQDTTKLRAE